jgi:SAM-dependent methyltransferase
VRWPDAGRALRGARRIAIVARAWLLHRVSMPPPQPFVSLLDVAATRGAGWISEAGPVSLDVPAAGGPLAVDPRVWRYALVRDVVATRGERVPVHLRWEGTTASHARWYVRGGDAPPTYALDLWAATAWTRAGLVRSLRVDGDGVTAGAVTLLADLAQLERGDVRWPLARRHVLGVGIECGALQNPLHIRGDVRCFYVDRLTPAQASDHYVELENEPVTVTAPDVVGDAHRLPIGDGALDFYVGNHLLEHAEDAVGALLEMLRVVRPGGVVYVSVPDVGNPLDALRPVTPLAHHVADHDERASRAAADRAHYREYVESAHASLPAEEREAVLARFVAQRYSIHFHTFDEETFRAVLALACERAGATVVEFARNACKGFDEYVAVLRRR